MSTIQTLLIGNDTIFEVDRLKDELTGSFKNAATVTVTLVDADGAQVAGDTWPKTLDYVTGSSGVYRATLPYTLDLEENARYDAQVSVNAGAGLRAAWTVECVARKRR